MESNSLVWTPLDSHISAKLYQNADLIPIDYMWLGNGAAELKPPVVMDG